MNNKGIEIVEAKVLEEKDARAYTDMLMCNNNSMYFTEGFQPGKINESDKNLEGKTGNTKIATKFVQANIPALPANGVAYLNVNIDTDIRAIYYAGANSGASEYYAQVVRTRDSGKYTPQLAVRLRNVTGESQPAMSEVISVMVIGSY